jgi:hypothetical protein
MADITISLVDDLVSELAQVARDERTTEADLVRRAEAPSQASGDGNASKEDIVLLLQLLLKALREHARQAANTELRQMWQLTQGQGRARVRTRAARHRRQALHAVPPQTCGKVERFHQTVKRYLSKQTPATSLNVLQAQLERSPETSHWLGREDSNLESGSFPRCRDLTDPSRCAGSNPLLSKSLEAAPPQRCTRTIRGNRDWQIPGYTRKFHS